MALDRWWIAFGDDQLNELIDTALAKSTTARLAYALIIEARAARRQTNASTLPSGSLSATTTEQGATRLWDGGSSQNGQASLQATFYPSWELDLFGRLGAIRQRADLDYRVSALDFYAARISLAAEVASALFQARFLAVQLDNARDAARISDQLVRSGRPAFARGLISAQDAQRLEADLASSEAEVIRLEAELRAAKRSLLVLVGNPDAPTTSMAIVAKLASPPTIPEATPGILLSRRPDVLRAMAQLEAAAQTIKIDRLALFPRVTIQPGLGLTASDHAGTGLWSIAAGLTAPILDRARLLAALRVSEARGEQSVVLYEQAVQTAFGETENALNRVDAGRRRLDQLERATELSQTAFDNASRGYTAGLTDLTTLLQVERTWLQNRSTLAAARSGLLGDTIAAIRAMGGGWDPQSTIDGRSPLPASLETR